jgi:flagellar biosynthetic protein FliR
LDELQKFGIIFARILGIMSFIPGFGAQFVPIKLRFGLTFVLSFITLPYAKIVVQDFLSNFLIEFLTGCFVGLLSKIFFEALSVVSSLISLQSGLSHSYSASLNASEQSAVFYNYLFLMTIFGIFDTGLSHIFIKSIISSYTVLPFGEMPNMGDAASLMSSTVSKSFLLAFKLTAPLMITNFTLILGGGLLSRLIPSFQAFLILTPAQNLVMLFVFSITMQSIVLKFIHALGEVAKFW